MRKFIVIVEGSNCALSFAKRAGLRLLMFRVSKAVIRKYGFFATRWVEAVNEQRAKELAIEMVAAEILTNSSYAGGDADAPIFCIDKIEEVMEYPDDASPAGFTFFEERPN